MRPGFNSRQRNSSFFFSHLLCSFFVFCQRNKWRTSLLIIIFIHHHDYVLWFSMATQYFPSTWRTFQVRERSKKGFWGGHSGESKREEQRMESESEWCQEMKKRKEKKKRKENSLPLPLASSWSLGGLVWFEAVSIVVGTPTSITLSPY